MNMWRISGWRIVVAVVLFGFWEGLSLPWADMVGLGDGSREPFIDPFWFSRPSDIAVYIWQATLSGQLPWDLYMTFKATAIGYVIGALLGLTLGLAMAQSEATALVLKPFILAIYGIPRIALAPIFILWFGIALTSKVMMAAMMTFMLVFFNTYEGVRAADIELRNVARVLGANRWQLFWNVTIPNASPWIIAGLRISIPQALVAAVVAEFIASTSGLGYRIMETTSSLDTTGTMAGILVLMVVVIVLNTILDRGENRVLRWRPKENNEP